MVLYLCLYLQKQKLLIMENEMKFKKVAIAVRVMPNTKIMLDWLRLKTGLPIGVLIDNLVKKEYDGQN